MGWRVGRSSNRHSAHRDSAHRDSAHRDSAHRHSALGTRHSALGGPRWIARCCMGRVPWPVKEISKLPTVLASGGSRGPRFQGASSVAARDGSRASRVQPRSASAPRRALRAGQTASPRVRLGACQHCRGKRSIARQGIHPSRVHRARLTDGGSHWARNRSAPRLRGGFHRSSGLRVDRSRRPYADSPRSAIAGPRSRVPSPDGRVPMPDTPVTVSYLAIRQQTSYCRMTRYRGACRALDR